LPRLTGFGFSRACFPEVKQLHCSADNILLSWLPASSAVPVNLFFLENANSVGLLKDDAG